MRVLVNANFGAGAPAFAAAVAAMLDGMGLSTLVTETETMILIDAASGFDAIPPDIATPIDAGPPALEVEITPDEAALALATAAPEVQVELPPQPPVSGQLVLQSLYSGQPIPFTVRPENQASVLNVQNLSSNGDLVSFNFCGLEFKAPIDRPEYQSIIANCAPQFTDTSIRVMVTIIGQPDPMPVLLQLVASDDFENLVIFGQDMLDALLTLTTEVSHDKVPAQ